VDNIHILKGNSVLKWQEGIVLISCLLLLLVLSILSIYVLDMSVLELKMSDNFLFHAIAFQNSESELRKKEKWLSENGGNGQLPSMIRYDQHLSNSCVNVYHIQASSRYLNANVVLASFYAIPDTKAGPCEGIIHNGRISWQQVD